MDRYRFKTKIKFAIYCIVAVVWQAAGLRFLLGRKSRKARVLIYHKVNNHEPNLLSISVPLFRRQMEHLKKHFNVVTVRELVNRMRDGRCFAPRTVAITFDDGYKDNYLNAYPVLKELGLPALIFLPAGHVGTGKILDHDRSFDPAFNPVLDWDDAQDMGKDLVDFGAHTVNHTILSSVDNDVAYREIRESKKMLGEKLDREIDFFAYPVGSTAEYDETHVKYVEECGFHAAFSGMSGSIGKRTKIFEIPRCGVEPGSFYLFKRVLDGSLDPIVIKDRGFAPLLKKVFNRILGTPS